MSAAENPAKQSQFSIASLLKTMTIAALIVFAITGGKSTGTIRATFPSLPPDDTRLQQWYAQTHAFDDVQIQRSDQGGEQELTVIVTRRFGFSVTAVPQPPWRELGYPPPRRTIISFAAQLLKVPPHVFFGGIVILVVCWLWDRRRRAKSPSEAL